jgi:hypothetical protein
MHEFNTYNRFTYRLLLLFIHEIRTFLMVLNLSTSLNLGIFRFYLLDPNHDLNLSSLISLSSKFPRKQISHDNDLDLVSGLCCATIICGVVTS